MRAGRRLGIPALLLSCVMLFGCVQQQSAKKPSPVHSVKTLQFAVSANLDKELLEQAELFAADVDRISQGRLFVNVLKREGETPPDSEYDLACLRNSQLAQFHPALATLSLPFLYNDATHLSLALNAPDMKRLVESRLQGSVVSLAALSSGSTLLVTTQAPAEKDVTNSSLMPIYFQDMVLAVHSGTPETVMAFQALGAQVALEEGELTRLLGQETAIPPVSPEQEAVSAVFNTVEATMDQVLTMPADTSGRYVLETRHDLSPVWLVMRESAWEGLSRWEQAVIQEATASLIAGFEDNRGRYRSTWRKEVGKRGMELLTAERQALTATIYDSGNGSAYFLLPDYFDKKLFDMVQSYS